MPRIRPCSSRYRTRAWVMPNSRATSAVVNISWSSMRKLYTSASNNTSAALALSLRQRRDMDQAVSAVGERASRPKVGIPITSLSALADYVQDLVGASWVRSELDRFDRWVQAESAPLAVMQLGDRPL